MSGLKYLKVKYRITKIIITISVIALIAYYVKD